MDLARLIDINDIDSTYYPAGPVLESAPARLFKKWAPSMGRLITGADINRKYGDREYNHKPQRKLK